MCLLLQYLLQSRSRRGGRENGGHVLRETTSRGQCELVCPSRTNERGGEGYCVKGGGGEIGERERGRAGKVRLHNSLDIEVDSPYSTSHLLGGGLALSVRQRGRPQEGVQMDRERAANYARWRCKRRHHDIDHQMCVRERAERCTYVYGQSQGTSRRAP